MGNHVSVSNRVQAISERVEKYRTKNKKPHLGGFCAWRLVGGWARGDVRDIHADGATTAHFQGGCKG